MTMLGCLRAKSSSSLGQLGLMQIACGNVCTRVAWLKVTRNHEDNSTQIVSSRICLTELRCKRNVIGTRYANAFTFFSTTQSMTGNAPMVYTSRALAGKAKRCCTLSLRLSLRLSQGNVPISYTLRAKTSCCCTLSRSVRLSLTINCVELAISSIKTQLASIQSLHTEYGFRIKKIHQM